MTQRPQVRLLRPGPAMDANPALESLAIALKLAVVFLAAYGALAMAAAFLDLPCH